MWVSGAGSEFRIVEEEGLNIAKSIRRTGAVATIMILLASASFAQLRTGVSRTYDPKGEALKCESCHGPKGVLDFRKLGYGEERIKKLSGGY